MSKLNWITPLAVAIIIGGFVLGSLLGTPGHFGLAKQLADQSIRIGHPVSPFRAIDSRGRVSDILADVSGRPAFVYVYTPACRWCRANLANLRAVARAISATRRVVFVSRDAAVSPEYAAILPTAEMYKSPTQDTISAFDLDGVPRTFVISPDRVLAGHWRGAYIGPNQTEIERFFRISLPGLDNSSIKLRGNTILFQPLTKPRRRGRKTAATQRSSCRRVPIGRDAARADAGAAERLLLGTGLDTLT